jgi:hypothetical protein
MTMTKIPAFTTFLPAATHLQVIDAVAGPVERSAEALGPTDEVLVIVNGRPCYRPVAQIAPCTPPQNCVAFADGSLSPGIPTRPITVAAAQRLSIAFPLGIQPVPAAMLPNVTAALPGDHWVALTIQGAESVVAEALRLATGPLAEPETADTPMEPPAPPAEDGPPPTAPLRAHAGLREIPPHGFERAGGHAIWRFTVPPRTTTIRLSSPSVQPPGDPRQLGVAILQLAMDETPIPLESPALVRGFHRAESGEGLTWRWTDGDALLILPPRPAEQVLTVRITDWHLMLTA